ncbi:MAG: RNA polymerase factor sigma-54 [Schleiferiaceae bacterium]|nr:RNA polymerase factor sigma-54 [Schleiferiaceae bacterium]MDP4629016.1 RNA polymerase factor sigma-54 [Schleiferiaceae bacterium]MDP4773998.1 RNA polymerase factor sigma-54 [Schleiferiaceae bacterium]MDP4932598.1 RNA polymerase factor sigma-54 [Schleiferiaceae bacterium]
MLRQSQVLKLQQKLSPQQIQLMKLIQLPTQALEDRIQEELEVNPALETESQADEDPFETDYEAPEDDYSNAEEDERYTESKEQDFSEELFDDTPEYRLNANNYSADDETYEAPIVARMDLSDVLHEQLALRSLAPQKEALCKYLIGTLDDDGYLRRELVDIVDDLAFSLGIFIEPSELEEALRVVQSMDPAGVGARNLQECMTLQLARRPDTPTVLNARALVVRYFDELAKRHYSRMMQGLGTNEEGLKSALEEISRINPKPGGSATQGAEPSQVVVPDFLVTSIDNKLELKLNGRNAPELNVSREYKEMLAHYRQAKGFDSDKQKEAFSFIKGKIDSAKWFIEAIKQRQQTLLLTMSAIMRYQEDYFLTGDDRKLKPMILKDIADEVGMDISTVSRVASQKYVQTPFGTFLIKRFFSESMTNSEGEEVSTREIKKILEESIGEEDSRDPLTDDALAVLLKDKGYPIARRTVAKYREQLGLPVARLRKTL